VGSLSNKLDDMRRRVLTLARSALAASGELSEEMDQAFEDLANAMEEFQAADNELRAQNDELVHTHAQLEAQRRRYQELFAFAPDGYLVTDMRGVIQEANQAAVALFDTP
jgi:PAS domain-containing protein